MSEFYTYTTTYTPEGNMSPNLAPKQLSFRGEGSKLFGIYIVNMLLTVITLGLYYPWAKAANLRYLYQETTLDNDRFTFHGTGKEMFRGFIKAILLILGLYLVTGLISYFATKTGIMLLSLLSFLVLMGGFIYLIPVAIHGSMKYRLSRSSWRGIHFGYRGDRATLMKEFFVGTILTMLTLGFYNSWFITALYRYVIGHIRFGNVEFSFEGKGSDYFVINLKGVILSILTLGIYMFWYIKENTEFMVHNTKMHQEGRTIDLRINATVSDYFALTIGNYVLVLFTLGLGTPWAIIRTMEFYTRYVSIGEGLDANAIRQTESDYRDATGEDLSDMMDLGIV